MINMGELFAHDRIKNQPMDRVPMTESEIERFGIHPGDLLFARQSLVADGAGKCSIVLTAPEVTTFESHLIRVRLNQEIADPLYFFYYFCSPSGKGNVHSLVMQVAAAGIRGSELAKLPVPLPSIGRQRRIASILCGYDDLIENNTRRIAILEEMARRIYEEWFVRFRFPGHENMRMVESELGPVPEGWSISPLSETAKMLSGFAFKSDTFVEDGNFGLVTIKNVHDGLFVEECSSRLSEIPAKMPAHCHLKVADILLSLTGNVGRCCLVTVEGCLLNQRVAKIQPREETDWAYSYLLFRSPQFQDRLIALASGVAQQNLSPVESQKLPVLSPPKELRAAFSSATTDFLNLTLTLWRKNANLRRTRDLLLPKLISGEVDVSAIPKSDDATDRDA